MTEAIRGAAAAAMDRGWAVFPTYGAVGGACTCSHREKCESPGKHPATTHGLNDAMRDFEQIEAWWPDGSPRGLAIATGAPSNVWVLDLDGPAAVDALLDLQSQHGKLPASITSKTARGWHLFFAMPAAGDVRNSTGKVAHGIDVRGSGGYAIVPPSLHPSGTTYTWARDRSPEEIAPAAAPAWLLALAAPPPASVVELPAAGAPHGSRYVQAAIEAECTELAQTHEGQRNDRLNRAAYSLARLVAAGEADALDVARNLAAAASRAGLAPREIDRTIRSALTARGAA